MKRRPVWIRRVWIGALTGALMVTVSALVAPVEAHAETRAERRARAARLKTLLAEENKVADALDALDRAIDEVVQRQGAIQARQKALKTELAALDRKGASLSARLDILRARMKRRLRARARMKAAGSLQVLLTARSPTELIRRRHYLKRIVAHDLVLTRTLNEEERAFEQVRADQAAGHAEVDALAEELKDRRAALERDRALRNEALAAVRQEGRLLRQVQARRRAARRGLKQVTRRKAAAMTGIAAEKGHLLKPVVGQVIRTFGPWKDPHLGTKTISKGWEIGATLGTPVRAIHKGEVVYAGWYQGFGNLVILDHGDQYHSLYAHLSAIEQARGETVAQGAIIGRTGDTGSLKGAMLYFELRHRGQAVDPAAWIRKGGR